MNKHSIGVGPKFDEFIFYLNKKGVKILKEILENGIPDGEGKLIYEDGKTLEGDFKKLTGKSKYTKFYPNIRQPSKLELYLYGEDSCSKQNSDKAQLLTPEILSRKFTSLTGGINIEHFVDENTVLNEHTGQYTPMSVNGKYMEQDGTLIAEGKWENGRFVEGWGKYVFTGPNIVGGKPDDFIPIYNYEGNFLNGEHHGNGKLTRINDNVTYHGEFKFGREDGNGTLNINNYVFEGVFNPDSHGLHGFVKGMITLHPVRWGLELVYSDNIDPSNICIEKNRTKIKKEYLYCGRVGFLDIDYTDQVNEQNIRVKDSIRQENKEKFLGTFDMNLRYCRFGVRLSDGVLTTGIWNNGVLEKIEREVIFKPEYYENLGDQIIKMKRKNPVTYKVKLVKILNDLNFILDNRHWAMDSEDKYETLELIRDRIIELDSNNALTGRSHISQSLKERIFKKYGNKCAICGSPEFPEIDHIMPYSKGGTDTFANLQLLCRSCNRKKSDKI